MMVALSEKAPVEAGSRPSADSCQVVAVQLWNPLREPAWDHWLASHPEATVFHTAAWAEVLHRSYGHVPCYVGTRAAQEWRGLLPLMEVSSPLTGRRGVSLPFTDQCDMVGRDAALAGDLVQAALAEGRRRRWRYLELRSVSSGIGGLKSSLGFYGHTVDLTPGPEALLKSFDSAVRRAIRKAEKLGLTAEVSASEEGLRAFFNLHCRTRKKHGLPPQPLVFFENIARCILARRLGVVVTARKGSTPLASGVFFRFGRRAVFKYGASDPGQLEHRGNNLVMWTAIQWLAERGCAVLDLGRTSLHNEGLRRFKRGWAATEHRMDYVRYDFRRQTAVPCRDQAFGWHNRLFAILPTGWLRWAGRLLYPHLS